MKRLIVCCDGTWQHLGSPYPTNVVKIAQAIKRRAKDGVQQILFYDEGIGTESFVKKFWGGAFGWGIDKNIQDAYRFLCLNYAPGDEIYLFGFSRGAYTVRSLAGMIYCSGLMSRANIRKAVSAYGLYRDRHIKPRSPEAQRFRQENGSAVPITVLGCWDTVGALGIPDQLPGIPINDWINKRYQFHDTVLSPIIHYALHGIAIDELRQAFAVTPMHMSARNSDQILKQVWFAGDHGCVGGGSEVKCGLSDCALQWMIEELAELGLGLEFDVTTVPTGINPDPNVDFDNAPQGIFRLGSKKERELIGTFADLHLSVKRRWQTRSDYRPRNLKQRFEAKLNAWIETVSEALA